mgnify:CR=1 FL=1
MIQLTISHNQLITLNDNDKDNYNTGFYGFICWFFLLY